jgi:polar amino acid transport system permease protein
MIFMGKPFNSSHKVRTKDSARQDPAKRDHASVVRNPNWFWKSPDDRDRSVSGVVLAFNWALALVLLSILCVFSFSSLTYHWNWKVVGKYSALLINGWKTTLAVSCIALLTSTCIGMITALARRSGLILLQVVCRLYVELIRGTPFLVQIMFGFYVVAPAFKFDNRLIVGVLVLSLFSGAYISEVIRSGIESIGRGQWDAAWAMGLSRSQVYRYIIFPQAIRLILPPMSGMFANLIKDSSLLSVIAIQEYTWSGQNVSSLTYSNFECYILLTAGYLILTLPISLWTQRLEQRV